MRCLRTRPLGRGRRRQRSPRWPAGDSAGARPRTFYKRQSRPIPLSVLCVVREVGACSDARRAVCIAVRGRNVNRGIPHQRAPCDTELGDGPPRRTGFRPTRMSGSERRPSVGRLPPTSSRSPAHAASRSLSDATDSTPAHPGMPLAGHGEAARTQALTVALRRRRRSCAGRARSSSRRLGLTAGAMVVKRTVARTRGGSDGPGRLLLGSPRLLRRSATARLPCDDGLGCALSAHT
jgi:hypothetical protein